jgi:hypothetical protein
MDISRDLQDLLKTEWRFSLEIRESAVFVWVGDYAHRIAADAVFPSMDEAIEWLRFYLLRQPAEG